LGRLALGWRIFLRLVLAWLSSNPTAKAAQGKPLKSAAELGNSEGLSSRSKPIIFPQAWETVENRCFSTIRRGQSPAA
jgi:hypothetical protein